MDPQNIVNIMKSVFGIKVHPVPTTVIHTIALPRTDNKPYRTLAVQDEGCSRNLAPLEEDFVLVMDEVLKGIFNKGVLKDTRKV